MGQEKRKEDGRLDLIQDVATVAVPSAIVVVGLKTTFDGVPKSVDQGWGVDYTGLSHTSGDTIDLWTALSGLRNGVAHTALGVRATFTVAAIAVVLLARKSHFRDL